MKETVLIIEGRYPTDDVLLGLVDGRDCVVCSADSADGVRQFARQGCGAVVVFQLKVLTAFVVRLLLHIKLVSRVTVALLVTVFGQLSEDEFVELWRGGSAAFVRWLEDGRYFDELLCKSGMGGGGCN